MQRIGILTSLFAGIVLSGCATTSQGYSVSVSGLAAPSTNSALSFIILPGNTNITATDLQFQEYSGIVERALTRRARISLRIVEKNRVPFLCLNGLFCSRTAHARERDTVPCLPPCAERATGVCGFGFASSLCGLVRGWPVRRPNDGQFPNEAI